MRLLSWLWAALVCFRLSTPLLIGSGRSAAAHVRRLTTLADVRRDRRIQVGSEIDPAATAAETPLDDFPDLHNRGHRRFSYLQTRSPPR
jgi:hypothetical protein